MNGAPSVVNVGLSIIECKRVQDAAPNPDGTTGLRSVGEGSRRSDQLGRTPPHESGTSRGRGGPPPSTLGPPYPGHKTAQRKRAGFGCETRAECQACSWTAP